MSRFKRSDLSLEEALGEDINEKITTAAPTEPESASVKAEKTESARPPAPPKKEKPSVQKVKPEPTKPTNEPLKLAERQNDDNNTRTSVRLRVPIPEEGQNKDFDRLAANVGSTKALGHLLTKAIEYFENKRGQTNKLPNPADYKGQSEHLMTTRKLLESDVEQLRSLVDPFRIETESMTGTLIGKVVILNYLPHFKL